MTRRATSTTQLSKLILTGLLLFQVTMAQAEVRVVTGEFLFGPDVAQRQACEAAEQRAKQEALRQVLGERVSTSQQLSCRDGGSQVDNTDCVFNTFMWTEIDGDIKQATRLAEPAIERLQGSMRCTVTMRVTVDVPTLQPDPGFDFQASLSSIRFRSGEVMSFELQSAADMHLAVFAWAPVYDKDLVHRIFPNMYDTQSSLSANVRLSIPTPQGAHRYKLDINFPPGVQQDFVDEYLIFVATKKPIAWLEQYEFEQFRSRLREIAPPDKRVVKHSYRIIR